jgi:hypothetical protein
MGILKGLGIGAAIAATLFIAAFIVELANCMLCGSIGCMTSSRCAAETGWMDATSCVHSCCGYSCAQDSSAHGVFPIWKSNYFWNTAIFCTIAGGIVGTFYGISIQKHDTAMRRKQQMELEEQEKQRRIEMECDIVDKW